MQLRVDEFVHLLDETATAGDEGINFSVINTEAQGSVLLSYRQNR